ncbi:MAG: NUDIX domain-containing protein [Microthrixaceae bacterium]
MKHRIHLMLLRVFGALPRRVRRILVRLGSPKYTVGAICIVHREDGRILLVKQSYGTRWGTPGGLAKRHEFPQDAAVRETKEEVNLRIVLVSEAVVVVEPIPHRVDVVYLAKAAQPEFLQDVRPSSPEIEKAEWFNLSELPEMQVETVAALLALSRSGVLDLSATQLLE